ncbi:MAG: hypothetical protein ACO25B_08115 [Chitinophagaceae bacterium]
MKRSPLLVLLISFFCVPGLSQAYEDKIQYDKDKQAAIAVEYPYREEALENAFIDRMRKAGAKPKEEKGFLNRDKGFIVFKDAQVSDISKSKYDYVIKVEKKTKKAINESVLYLIILKGDENIIASMSNADIAKTKKFMNNLLPDVEAADLELQIRDAEQSLTDAEKRLRTLQGEKEELDKKTADNVKAQEETTKEIASRKLSVETLKGKRK